MCGLYLFGTFILWADFFSSGGFGRLFDVAFLGFFSAGYFNVGV